MLGTTSAQSPLVSRRCLTRSGCTPSMVSVKTPKQTLNRAAFTFSVTAVKTFPLVSVYAVTSEGEPGGDNLTLTCVLTCTRECEKDFSLTWSGSGKNSWQSGLMNVNNTLRNKLVLPALSVASDELSCLVLREGDMMASKKWRTVNCEYASCCCCLFS